MEDLRRRVTAAQRRGTHGTAAKDIMLLLAVICLGAAGIYWWKIQSSLTIDMPVAIAFTAILTLAPPVLTSFCIPWSPGGMLLQKVNARTWGMLAVIGCAIYLGYYSYQIQWSYWAAQQVVADANLAIQQALIGIIGFIIIPALLWTPVSSEELEEKLKQAQLVKRYELQTQADIAILQATLLRAQQQALTGFANLAVEEREELAAVMRGLVGGIDETIQKMAGNLNRTATTVYGPKAGRALFSAPAFADDMIDLLDYVADALVSSRTTSTAAPRIAPPADGAVIEGVAAPVRTASEPAPARHASVVVRDDLRSSETIPDREAYVTARHEMGMGAWMVKDLAETLSIEESTARKLKAAWMHAGGVVSAGLNGRFKFTEGEV